jgi:hypothetical protein
MSVFASIFDEKKFKEPFNRKAALYLQKNITYFETDIKKQESCQNNIDKLLTQSKGEAFINVTYDKAAVGTDKQNKKQKDHGRWFAKTPGALQGMCRRIRQTICDGEWIDIDFVNCHPVVLAGMCQNTFKIPCPFLEKYLQDREVMLQEMVEGGVPNRDEAKKKVLKALNGGIVTDVKTPWWDALQQEFAYIASVVALHSDNAQYLQEGKEDKRGDYNLYARTMNKVLCEEENKCLEVLFIALKDEGLVTNTCSLIFDGLMIPDTTSNREKITQPGFFMHISKKIFEITKHQIEVKIKEFDEIYELPADYADTVSDIFVVDPGNDAQAATEFFKRFPGKLVKSQGRTFFMNGGIYTEHPKMVREGIVGAIRGMEIYIRSSSPMGELTPYSQNRRHIDDCAQLIMQDNTIEDHSFVDKLFTSSLHYMAFEDGIYSFKTKELLPYPVKDVFFTIKINRPFPRNVDPEVTRRIMKKVLEPIFPDENQMRYYFHRMARSLAGAVQDKLWHINIGERNCGKGVVGDFMRMAFQDFVSIFNSESLLCNNMPSGDAAKAQSWISPLEFKRIIFSNEMKLQGGRAKLDGNMIKRIASGGDEIQTRTNHKDEVNKRIQCTMWLNANDIAPCDPPDAFQTLQVFSFQSAFIPANEMEERGDTCPRHWKPEDSDIKTWINTPENIDAFTMFVLGNYDTSKCPVPECVSMHSNRFKGASSVRDIDRFAEVVKYNANPKNRVFTAEIIMALNDAGLKGISANNVGDYVEKLYGNKGLPPKSIQFEKCKKRARGYSHIILNCIVEFNILDEKRVENMRKSETVRKQIRNEEFETTGKRKFDDISEENNFLLPTHHPLT